MPQDSNPFNCQNYSSPEVFVDRDGSASAIAKGLVKTANGNPHNFLIVGKRGIGKSSTLEYIDKKLTEDKNQKYRFLSVLFKIESSTKRTVLIEGIADGIKKEIAKVSFYESSRNFLRSLWGYISEIKILGSGVKLNDEKIACNTIPDLSQLIAKNAPRARLRKEDINSGILIMLDEADNSSDKLALGEFLKILIESVRDSDCSNASFIVSGLPELEGKLHSSHESVLRLFTKIELKRLNEDATAKLLKNGIRSANRKRHTNGKTKVITMEDSIMSEVYKLTKGHPYKVQKLAASMYDFAEDDVIRYSDLVGCPVYQELSKAKDE